MADLRTQVIRLAAEMPKGSTERKAILDVLAQTNKRAGATWHVYLEEMKQAFVSDTLGQATAILRSSGASGFKEGPNHLNFELGGHKGQVTINWAKQAHYVVGQVIYNDMWNRRGEEEVPIMALDPKGLALKVLYLTDRQGQPVLPL
jgi:hypothetical protein